MRFIFIIIFISFSSKGQNLYFPGKLWEEKSPESQGIDSKKLDKAIEFAISNENAVDKDLRISADGGEPLTYSKPNHEISKLFKSIAEKIKQSFL